VPKEKINFIDSSFYNLNSVNSSSIPLFQHNDSTRMLMAANMQKQAVIPLKGEAPLIASGIEHYLLSNAPLTIKANSAGIVNYVDSEKIVINQQEYLIRQFQVSNTNSLLTLVPIVEKGETVQAEQIIACGNYQEEQELALGQNLRVAFMC
jgi:DNA-directed RNA polymerase subunit beta